MRSVLFMLLILLILAGTACTDPSATDNQDRDTVEDANRQSDQVRDKPEPEVLMKPTGIKVRVHNPYSFSHTTIEREMDDADQVVIPLYSEHAELRLQFSENLEETFIKESVTIRGDDKPRMRIEDNALIIKFEKPRVGKSYDIEIGGGPGGGSAQEQPPFHLKVIMNEPTIAETRVLEAGESVEIPYDSPMPEVGGEEPQLTDTPKTFEIHFSAPVNHQKAEEIIRRDLNEQGAEYHLSWKDDMTVQIELEAFHQRNYQIHLSDIQDLEGNNVANDLFFTVDQANELYVYDRQDGSMQPVKSLKLKRYTANQHPFLKDYLLLADNYQEYLYQISSDRMDRLVDDLGFPRYLGMGPWTPEVQWLNSDTVLYLHQETKQLVTYSFSDYKMKRIVDLSPYIEDHYDLFDCRLSPDGSKVALAISNNADDTTPIHFSIYVFSMNGDKLYENHEIKKLRQGWAAGPYYLLYLGWLNQHELIYEMGEEVPDSETQNKHVNIYKTNINSGETEKLMERAVGPVTFPDYQAYAAKKYSEQFHDGQYVWVAGQETFPLGEPYMENLHMIGPDKLIYNRPVPMEESEMGEWVPREKEVVLMNLRTGEKKVVGTGEIIGQSPDGRLFYIMTHQRFLLPVS